MATTRTITDAAGRSVVIPTAENIHQVAILTSPPNVMAFVVGVQDKICATTNAIGGSTFLQGMYPRLKTIPAVRAGGGKVNIEGLLQTNPDFCIGSDIDIAPVNNATKIPTLQYSDFSTTPYPDPQKKEVRFFGTIFGKDAAARAEKYCTFIDNNVTTIKSATSGVNTKLKVYMGFNADHLTTFGGDTFMDQWIEAAHCVNAAKPVSTISGSEGGLAAMSMEQILSWNPDIVVIDTGKPEDLYSNPTWANVPAIKNKQVYLLPKGMFGWNRASTEPAALFPMWLAITAYPTKFPNTTVEKEIKKFYSEIIQYNLTDADVNTVLGK